MYFMKIVMPILNPQIGGKKGGQSGQDFGWGLHRSSCSNGKMAFFIHLLYARFQFIAVWIPKFSILVHFCDFYKPFVYQNSHLLTTYQNFRCIPAVYQSEKTPCFVFAMNRLFLGDIVHGFGYLRRYTINMVINTGSMCMKVLNFFLLLKDIDIIYIFGN